jgi:RimJ/RimL family protein N-acetyltransferase
VKTPPYRIVTERLVIRCWNPADAPLAKEAVDSSREHLRRWMPWADQPPTPVDEHAALLRRFRARFDLDEDYVYGIFAADEPEVVGGTGLHTRAGDSAYEIGYWIRASRANQGLATEATAALTRVAFELCGADRVELHIEAGNAASLRIPAKLGYREEATLRRRIGGTRDEVIFTLFGDEYGKSPSASAAFEAYDAVGARLP